LVESFRKNDAVKASLEVNTLSQGQGHNKQERPRPVKQNNQVNFSQQSVDSKVVCPLQTDLGLEDRETGQS
jgi:hypothetical protein